ncbi:hypothetical protein [Victivallis sp. Marseille-Q1083]|uniref:hypothetical protein n=1 Tax=Victivallis sp. Marseille-Q1083 TaxID=2717288 RepID=UPI00158A682B|nr:hypothetical protein [Victivallis sp. Marseille-Q1083]
MAEFKSRYFDALLNLVWRQWTRLGIPGHIDDGIQQHYVIDPEVLLLFSAWFCRYDQRLYDLVIDWLRLNGNFINLQRIKSLGKKVYRFDSASLGVMVNAMSDQGERRWTKFAEDLLPSGNASPVPLFRNFDGQPNDFQRTADERALRYGLIRNPYLPSGKVASFPVGEATFLLQLRGAFGLSARAETILALLNKDICKIQDIANISGFSWKSVQDVLAELSSASIVATHGEGKRGRYYFLKNPKNLLNLFEQQKASFPNWLHIYDALSIVFDTIANPRLEGLSERTVSGEIRRMFEEQIGESLLDVGVNELKFLNPGNLDHLVDVIAVL